MMRKLKFVILILCLLLCVTGYASNINVDIDNKNIEFDVPPIMQNNRVLVPMRKIFEELGCDVEWLAESQTVVVTKNSKIIALQIGKNKIILNDIESSKMIVIQIDTFPIIHNNRTLVPVRVISECLGCAVDWDSKSGTVIIKTGYKT